MSTLAECRCKPTQMIRMMPIGMLTEGELRPTSRSTADALLTNLPKPTLPGQAAPTAQERVAQVQAMRRGIQTALAKRRHGDLEGFRDDVVNVFSLVMPRSQAETKPAELENYIRKQAEEGVKTALRKNIPIAVAINLGTSLLVSLLVRALK